MREDTPFVLFDDARAGGAPGRLYRNPVGEVVAATEAEVIPALERLRADIAKGRHAAGFLAYEAGFALDPALIGKAPAIPGPLLWFGLFDGYEAPPPIAGTCRLGPPRPRIECDAYLAAAARVREHLFAGDFYQANLTFGCDVTLLGDPLAAYAQLRREALAGWGGVVRHPGGWILSLSPEQFFTLRSGALAARPMKGTEPRCADDQAAIARLRGDPKQRAENLMIVDLLRNDLARIAETGSVAVPSLFEVETYPTVHQMVSAVTAQLRYGLDA
ncbi:MAG: chorismate-binding protein, partial [Sphingomicrobium sp.]